MKTINFLEALEANKTKRVRIAHGDFGWFGVAELRGLFSPGLSISDFEAKWEVEPPEVTITREKLEQAVNKCFYYYAGPKGHEVHKLFMHELAKELGL